MTTVKISGVSRGDYAKLFRFSDALDSKDGVIHFDFSQTRFLTHTSVAFLCGLVRSAQAAGMTVTSALEGIPYAVKENLKANGFLGIFDGPVSSDKARTIPLREDDGSEAHTLVNYLRNDWLGRDWVHLSDDLRDEIVGRVWEIYANAFEHAGSSVGVFSCGQYYPKIERLDLAVVDFGVGIPHKVRAHLDDFSLTGSAALSWAFQSGATTTSGDLSRGLGLDLLREFVRVNTGKLDVFSLDGHAIADESGTHFSNFDSGFRGTLVNISLVCDERYYVRKRHHDRPLF